VLRLALAALLKMAVVAGAAVKEARLSELRHEILNSKQLQSHFEDNPDDAKVRTNPMMTCA